MKDEAPYRILIEPRPPADAARAIEIAMGERVPEGRGSWWRLGLDEQRKAGAASQGDRARARTHQG